MIQLTRLAKVGGPLTKRISLLPDGTLKSDGSACLMARGNAQRVRLPDLGQVADLIQSSGSQEAIALGAMRRDLPNHVRVVTQSQLARLNGTTPPPADTIARTDSYIGYEPGHPALALVDVDTKGMPNTVQTRINVAGGFWKALVSVLPEMEAAGRIVRRSTSAGIIRTDTGEGLPGSNGLHIYLHTQDGADIERFLRTLHERCWLAGYGWHMVGAGGQLLDRSIVDRMVYAPSRLVFEGAPILVPPLSQDQEARRPVVFDHPPLDTKSMCPPLRIIEQVRLKDLKSRSAYALAQDQAKERDRFITKHASRLAERTGISALEARRVIERQCDGVILPDLILPWDDDEAFASCTVADVLADPAKFVGATLTDPLEGPDYGRAKAMVMRRPDGTPWINSFAHGHTVYELRYDARAVSAAIEGLPNDQAANVFVRIAVHADLGADEVETLRNLAAERAGVGKRTLDARRKATEKEHAERTRQEKQNREAAERVDPRPRIPAPDADAPWLPQMQVLNDVLGGSSAAEQPMRDADGFIAAAQNRVVPSMHLLTPAGANETEAKDSRLPPPEQALLTRLDDAQVAELIEEHVDYVDDKGRHVHLAMPFVKHFIRRSDGVLPVVTAVATLPLVRLDGTVLSGHGLNRKYGIVFRVPSLLEEMIPSHNECGPQAIIDAMSYLTEDWLADVSAPYQSKCAAIATALAVLERPLLPERPATVISAGQRGSGKTTLSHMISTATLGHRAAAAGWSPAEEERRKALLAYLGDGVPIICWDNIARGTLLDCPTIAKVLTSDYFVDRVLGETRRQTVPATSIQIFTGNNIRARGDLSSRSIEVRLEADRPDPENREFKHPDPIGWTLANRGKILKAFYTIMIGNPRVRQSNPPTAETRFKVWWHIIGSAVEHAASLHARDTEERIAAMVADAPTYQPKTISFKRIMAEAETDEDQTNHLSSILNTLHDKWPTGCQAKDIATFATEPSEAANEFRSALEAITQKPIKIISPTVVAWRLKAIRDMPALVGTQIMALRYGADDHGGMFTVKTVNRD